MTTEIIINSAGKAWFPPKGRWEPIENIRRTHTFRARIRNSVVEVAVVGKWRQLATYRGKRNLPPKQTMDEIRRIIWINTGKRLEKDYIRFDFTD